MPDFSRTNHLSAAAHSYSSRRAFPADSQLLGGLIALAAPNCPLIFRPDCKLAGAPPRTSRGAAGGIDFRMTAWLGGVTAMARWLRGIVRCRRLEDRGEKIGDVMKRG